MLSKLWVLGKPSQVWRGLFTEGCYSRLIIVNRERKCPSQQHKTMLTLCVCKWIQKNIADKGPDEWMCWEEMLSFLFVFSSAHRRVFDVMQWQTLVKSQSKGHGSQPRTRLHQSKHPVIQSLLHFTRLVQRQGLTRASVTLITYALSSQGPNGVS